MPYTAEFHPSHRMTLSGLPDGWFDAALLILIVIVFMTRVKDAFDQSDDSTDRTP